MNRKKNHSTIFNRVLRSKWKKKHFNSFVERRKWSDFMAISHSFSVSASVSLSIACTRSVARPFTQSLVRLCYAILFCCCCHSWYRIYVSCWFKIHYQSTHIRCVTLIWSTCIPAFKWTLFFCPNPVYLFICFDKITAVTVSKRVLDKIDTSKWLTEL